MVQVKPRFKSLEDYLAIDPAKLPAGKYELVNGELIELGAETDQNAEIASFLFSVLLQFAPYYLLRRGTEIAVPNKVVTSREPDLMLITEEIRNALPRDKRSLISLDYPAPRLVIELVSPGVPGSENYDRDYIQKRKEYAERGIPEYWLIDPVRAVVAVLLLVDGQYVERTFQGGDRLESPTFTMLQLTAEQILKAGN
jgi:Uma2 family endonuclease